MENVSDAQEKKNENIQKTSRYCTKQIKKNGSALKSKKTLKLCVWMAHRIVNSLFVYLIFR